MVIKFIPPFIFLTVVMCQQSTGQKISIINFYDSIKKYDLAAILTSDSFYLANDELTERAEPLGFIGDNFQRFYIHFISVEKKANNPYEYTVTGKTKVQANICSFQGTLRIISAKFYKDEFPDYKEGYAICEVSLFEDESQPTSGFIKGKLTTNFVIYKQKQFRYDGLPFYSDGFSNNQFVGKWTSYKTRMKKTCNWGDYRIPKCGDLDIGAAEFSVNEKYLKNGWENYQIAHHSDPDK